MLVHAGQTTPTLMNMNTQIVFISLPSNRVESEGTPLWSINYALRNNDQSSKYQIQIQQEQDQQQQQQQPQPQPQPQPLTPQSRPSNGPVML